jgi:hypothetical protein
MFQNVQHHAVPELVANLNILVVRYFILFRVVAVESNCEAGHGGAFVLKKMSVR